MKIFVKRTNNNRSNKRLKRCHLFTLALVILLGVHLIIFSRAFSNLDEFRNYISNEQKSTVTKKSSSSSSSLSNVEGEKSRVSVEETASLSIQESPTSSSSIALRKNLPSTTKNNDPVDDGHDLKIKSSDGMDNIKTAKVGNFTAYGGVAIVTKTLHHNNNKEGLDNLICLVNMAYNFKVDYAYDIIVFTTVPWPEEEVKRVQAIAAPAKLSVIVEGPTLEERIAVLSDEEQEFLLKRCGAEVDIPNATKKLTWFHHCKEKGTSLISNLGYSWQAEFRSYQIWTHPALKDYKYMMWFDTDVIPTAEWEKDPLQQMVEKNLTLIFTGFPYGRLKPKSPYSPKLQKKITKAYKNNYCDPYLNKKDGTLGVNICKDGELRPYKMVGGFWHLTNLDVYRQETHQQYLKSHVADYPFSRTWDDQLAVTIPAASESHDNPGKAVDLHSLGIHLNLAHHGMYDGDRNAKAPKLPFNVYEEMKIKWVKGHQTCSGKKRNAA